MGFIKTMLRVQIKLVLAKIGVNNNPEDLYGQQETTDIKISILGTSMSQIRIFSMLVKTNTSSNGKHQMMPMEYLMSLSLMNLYQNLRSE